MIHKYSKTITIIKVNNDINLILYNGELASITTCADFFINYAELTSKKQMKKKSIQKVYNELYKDLKIKGCFDIINLKSNIQFKYF